MNDNRESLARMGGWLVSLTLHGLSLGTALVLAAEFSILPEPRPFRWEVTMVSAPALQPVAADVPTPFSASSVSPSVMPRDKSPRQVRSRPNAANTEAARPLEAHSGIIHLRKMDSSAHKPPRTPPWPSTVSRLSLIHHQRT